MTSKNISRAVGLVALAAFGLASVGCDSMGNENPTSPQQMDQIRQKQEAERQNWQAPGGAKPTTGG